jgi:predicted transcriptional regulator
MAAPGQTLSYINTGKSASTLENRRRLSAAHVMSSAVITAVSHDLVSHVQQLMRDNDISHIVIIDNENHPLGMISANDLLKVESPQSSFIQSLLGAKVLAVSEDTLVRDIAKKLPHSSVSSEFLNSQLQRDIHHRNNGCSQNKYLRRNMDDLPESVTTLSTVCPPRLVLV